MTSDNILPEYTFEEFCALPMTLGLHVSGTKEHYLHRFNSITGINRVTITPVKKRGGFGTPKSFFYWARDEETYDTADQMYLAYMEYVCGVKS